MGLPGLRFRETLYLQLGQLGDNNIAMPNMKRIDSINALLRRLPTTLCQMSFLLFTLGTTAADVSGDWEFAAKSFDEVSPARLTLKMDGEKLTGNLNELKLEGTLKGDDLKFSAKRPNGDHFGDFTGKVQGDKLEGAGEWSGDRKITWTAKRAANPPKAPRVHDFEPTQFHRLFSDAIPPALHIFPGDTVRTWTVDAGGVDSKGVRRSLGGNPETGPFYIEGAVPGDTLVVKLNRVRLNRDSAISSSQIAGSALNPGYLQRTRYRNDFDSDWVLDRQN